MIYKKIARRLSIFIVYISAGYKFSCGNGSLHIKQYLNFSALRDAICQCATGILDGRQQSKVKYSLHDCLMSAWAMMHPDMRQVLHLATAMASS